MPFKQLRDAFMSGKQWILTSALPFIMQGLFNPQRLTAHGSYSRCRNLTQGNKPDILNGASKGREGSAKNGSKQCSRVWATRRREGSSRESKKDYLHFLYIARGSLSETQYFVHLSRRLGYLSVSDAEQLIGQTRQTFACLHGLIKAVEKETGKFGTPVVPLSVVSSLIFLCLILL
jgi:four helix bundle protein